MTWQTITVLRAFLSAARALETLHGFALIEATGLKTGTIYAILARLEADAFVRSWWDDGPVLPRTPTPAVRAEPRTVAARRRFEFRGSDARPTSYRPSVACGSCASCSASELQCLLAAQPRGTFAWRWVCKLLDKMVDEEYESTATFVADAVVIVAAKLTGAIDRFAEEFLAALRDAVIEQGDLNFRRRLAC